MCLLYIVVMSMDKKRKKKKKDDIYGMLALSHFAHALRLFFFFLRFSILIFHSSQIEVYIYVP